MSNPLLDGTSLLLHQGLSGLSRRQELIANNLANMDTPGYRSYDIPFEQVLDRRMNRSGDLPMVTTADLHLAPGAASNSTAVGLVRQGPLREDGNGVDIDYEMARLGETTIEYNAVTQLFAARMALLKSAVTDGRR